MNTQTENEARIKELKELIKHYKGLLNEPGCDVPTQVWIDLQIKEFRKELKSLQPKKP